MTVGRFAPTPSGRMHLGNVWSALLAWLSVRSAGGELVLRIEDLDPLRCPGEFAVLIRDDLRWLGLDWDREQAPQRERTAAYDEIFHMLEARGLLYPCYCSRAGIHAASAPHAADGRPIYAGTCRNLTPEERAGKKKAPAWRVQVPDRDYGFYDGVQGDFVENLARDWGDFSVRRPDGIYAYQLAVVADDAAGGITEVVRGRDLLASTPCQLYLYELLGATPPVFYHVPLLSAPGGRRLSKRDRDLDMGAIRERYRPEEVLGALGALAGLIPEGETASALELAGSFSWDKIPRDDLILSGFDERRGAQ